MHHNVAWRLCSSLMDHLILVHINVCTPHLQFRTCLQYILPQLFSVRTHDLSLELSVLSWKAYLYTFYPNLKSGPMLTYVLSEKV